MQTLTEIKSLLTAHGLWPKYRFGQNFLHDHNQMQKIIEAANISAGDNVLEVGAGTGALSECLLDRGASLIAVEIDKDLAPILEQRLESNNKNVKLIFEDVLASKHKLNPSIISELGGEPFTLVANLPYNTASPLLVNLALDMNNMKSAVVMVQKEVAKRLLTKPSSKNYGPLGIIIQALCEVTWISDLSPGCFWPKPKVASSVIKLTRKPNALIDNPKEFAKFLHKLFSKRRKQIKAILSEDIARNANIQPTARPESLSMEQLKNLFLTYTKIEC